jgi:hypothetical protein
LASSLTPQQNDLLRQIEGAPGLPAAVPRREHRSQDVERLCALAFIVSDSAGLAVTAAGMAHLDLCGSTAPSPSGRAIRVLHGRDQSISVEYRPQQP